MRDETARDRPRRILAVAVAILTVASMAGPAVAVSGGGHTSVDAATGESTDSGGSDSGIVYTDVTVAPSPANVSEPVTVATTVANRGSDSTRYNATLRIDGRVVAFETGRLAADERTRITFDHRFGTAGEHVVAVGSSSERTVSVSEGGTATVAGMVLPDEELREKIRDYRDRTDRELPAHAYVLLSRAGPYVLFTTEERQPVEMAVVTGDLPGETIVERGRSVPVLIARETRASGTDATTQAITDPSIGIDASTASPVAPGETTTVTVTADGVNVLLVGIPAHWSGGEIPGRYDRCGPPPSLLDPDSLQGVRNGSCTVEFHVEFTSGSTADVAASQILNLFTGNLGLLAEKAVDLLLDAVGVEDKLRDMLRPVFDELFEAAGITELDNAVWISSPNIDPCLPDCPPDQRTSVNQTLQVGVPANASDGTVGLPVVAADWDLAVEYRTVNLTVESDEPAPPSTEVAVTPSTNRIDRNATTTYAVAVRNASGAVGTFDTNVTLADPSIASVVDAQVRSPGRVTSVNISADNATVRLQNVGADAADTGSGTLARVTVRGDANGTTPVRLTGENVYADENGTEYDVTLSNATLLVGQRRTPDVTGDGQAATDIDGDGKLEDVTGDGSFDVLDVAALLDHLDDPAVERNVAMFDVNEDGTINILDVTALLRET